ncbi:MAG: hypothetical protein SGI92_10910 [Bryobacteraceae bacterium]|nr:hypothetical protein [Bryobacteraceae bacterium]
MFPRSSPGAVSPVQPLGEPPVELVAALRDGTCMLFTGEEFSRQCGMPVWHYLMLGLGDYLADTRRIGREDGDRLRQIHRDKKYGHVERIVRALLQEHPEAIPEYLAKMNSRPLMMPPAQELLKKLPFAVVVSPMPDGVAAKMGRETVRLRGDLFWPDEAEGPARALCAEVVRGRTVLFVGTSAAEIERWYGVAGAGPHFALLPKGQALEGKTAAKYGIRSLVYDVSTSQALVEFLKKLQSTGRSLDG